MDLKFRDWVLGVVLIFGTIVVGLVTGAGMIYLAKGSL